MTTDSRQHNRLRPGIFLRAMDPWARIHAIYIVPMGDDWLRQGSMARNPKSNSDRKILHTWPRIFGLAHGSDASGGLSTGAAARVTQLGATHRPRRSQEPRPVYYNPIFSKLSSARVTRIVLAEERCHLPDGSQRAPITC